MDLAVTLPDHLIREIEQRVSAKLREELAQPVGYLNVKSAARFLDTTPAAIRSMVKRGDLVPIRTPNGRLLFSVTALTQWAEGTR